jgi:AraC-like DNA-binding protein
LPGPPTIEIPQTVKNSELSPPIVENSSPAVSVIEIRDPTAVGENIEVIEQDAVQLASTPLRARRVIVRLDSTVLCYHSTNLPIRTHTVLQSGLVAFVAFGPRAVGTANGLPIGPDRVLVGTPGVTVEFVVAAGYESVCLFLPPDEIHAHLRGRNREEQFRFPAGVELLQTNGNSAAGLYECGRRLAHMATRMPEMFDAPETKCFAQIELVEAILATLGSSVDAEIAPRDVTRQAHSQIVRIVEDYVVSHAVERLHVTRLCEAAGVSERTLQYAFKEVMGMTPVAYLTRLRLHRVRRALRAATPRATTVTAEALRWGFWHFGDFSRAHKSCFGELPSYTLQQNWTSGEVAPSKHSSPEIADA